jgi:hypothetical protein
LLPETQFGNQLADVGDCAIDRLLDQNPLRHFRRGRQEQLKILAIAESVVQRGRISVGRAVLLSLAEPSISYSLFDGDH